MKKEILWVIITAFGLGLIITYGVLTARKALERQEEAPPETEEAQESQPETTPQPTTPPLSLTLYQPEDETVIKQASIVFKGKTAPLATIAILTEEDELILEADADGNFETEVDLIDGVNEIIISAFDEKGNEVSKTLTLVYTEAEI